MSNEKYVGLDVHKATLVIAVLNAVGQVVMRNVIATEATIIREFFQGLRGTIAVVLEEGTHATWLAALLKPLVKTVVVCDPRHNKLLAAGNKADQTDAEKLARLLRLGELKAVYKGNLVQQQLKDLAHAYENLVSDATRVMNRLKALYRGRGIKCEGHALYKPEQRAQWLAKLPEAGARCRAQWLLEELEPLQELRRQAKQELLKVSQQQPDAARLRSLPGIGPLRAALLLAYVGTPHRFRTKRQFWPYCGLAVITRTSAEQEFVNGTLRKRRKVVGTRGLNQHHVPALKQVFKAAALTALQRAPFQSWYQQRLAQGLRPELARVALARKLAATTLVIWQRQEQFDSSKVSATR